MLILGYINGLNLRTAKSNLKCRKCIRILASSEPDKNSSELPNFGGIVASDEEKARKSTSIESPLVDRALDSALDFLKDADPEAEEEDDEFDMFEIYDDAPDFDIPYDLIAELEQKEMDDVSNKMPGATEINKASIEQAMKRWRQHDTDVGSADVQVAIANEKVKYLTKHLLANKKDKSALRGLQSTVVARRKFLNFVYKTNQSKAEEMIKEMGIRFRPPGLAWDKADKYGAFKNTKNKFVVDDNGKKRKVKK